MIFLPESMEDYAFHSCKSTLHHYLSNSNIPIYLLPNPDFVPLFQQLTKPCRDVPAVLLTQNPKGTSLRLETCSSRLASVVAIT